MIKKESFYNELAQACEAIIVFSTARDSPTRNNDNFFGLLPNKTKKNTTTTTFFYGTEHCVFASKFFFHTVEFFLVCARVHQDFFLAAILWCKIKGGEKETITSICTTRSTIININSISL